MASSLIPDPLQMWRDALMQLESNVNSFVTGSLDSRDLVRSVHQLSAVSTGLQQAFEKAIGSYLAKVNLPSRKDVAELAEALRRIEDKVDRLAPPDAAHAMPRPARTRRPPDAEPTAAAPAASAKATAAARPRRPAAKRTSARAGSRS
ncbi:MAG TPA: hypothetical protein VMU47_07215 [Caldimonas sp.]|nr:hypothetical protein [Caldimonas sp.]